MTKPFKITGIDETELILKSIAPKHARNLSRSTVLATAKTVGQRIKAVAPVDEGDIKKSVKWKRKKSRPNKLMAVVFSKQVSGGYTPYWWRFQEHGTGGENPQPAKNFVKRSVNRVMTHIDKIFAIHFREKLSKKIEAEQKKLAKK